MCEQTVKMSHCSLRELLQPWGVTVLSVPHIMTSCTVWTETVFDVRTTINTVKSVSLTHVVYFKTCDNATVIFQFIRSMTLMRCSSQL